jgi:hypothetical protein
MAFGRKIRCLCKEHTKTNNTFQSPSPSNRKNQYGVERENRHFVSSQISTHFCYGDLVLRTPRFLEELGRTTFSQTRNSEPKNLHVRIPFASLTVFIDELILDLRRSWLSVMTRLLQPLYFIDSSSPDVMSPSSLWNAGRRVSQWLPWYVPATTETPVDVSKSLCQHPSSHRQPTAAPCSLLQDATPLLLRQNTVVPSSLLHHTTLPSLNYTNHRIPCINTLLPPEILGEIFKHYVCDDDNPEWLQASTRISAHVGAHTTAIFLCHVCSYWDFLAASNSSLWSSLCVMWPKRNMVHLVRLWLSVQIAAAFSIPWRVPLRRSIQLPRAGYSRLIH